jgi:hypothetical protein
MRKKWGEIIKKVGELLVFGLALLFVPVMGMADDFGLAGTGGVDILGDGIFETDISGIRFPSAQDTNVDSLQVGNDKANAFGSSDLFAKEPVATNNLEIKKNQDSGECTTCRDSDGFVVDCNDTCIKVNIETIKVGNRDAMAFGFASATNNVKIVTNQQ